MARTLLIDESLDKRLATELSARGRPSRSHAQLGTTGRVDEVVLQRLAELEFDWVLVTADDAMPLEHATRIRNMGATIATIDGAAMEKWRKRGALTQEEFKSETVHRWAHKMADQAAGTVRRYSPNTNLGWTPPRRRR